MDGRTIPLRETRQHTDNGLQGGLPFSSQVLLGGFFLVGLRCLEEEAAGRSHFAQRFRALFLAGDDGHQVRVRRHFQPSSHQLRPQHCGEACVVRQQHVLLVQPSELVRINRRRRLIHILDVEEFHQFREREQFLVAMGPTEPRQIVQQRLRQEAIAVILQHAHRAVALGKLGAVRAENHGQMRVDGHLPALAYHGAQHIQLTRRVVQVVVTANDMGDGHVVVVHYHAEVVGGVTVRALDDEVVQFLVLEHHAAVDSVFDHHLALVRVLEAHYGRNTGHRRLAVTAAAIVARLVATGLLLRAHGVELFFRAIAVVGLVRAQPVRDDFAITVIALRLVERAFVGVQAEPGHAFQNDAHGFVRGSLPVRILDA